MNQLKCAATRELTVRGLHPLAAYKTPKGKTPSPWGSRFWKLFLNDDAAIRRAIAYVEANPTKEGKRVQRWRFVTPLEQWLNRPR